MLRPLLDHDSDTPSLRISILNDIFNARGNPPYTYESYLDRYRDRCPDRALLCRIIAKAIVSFGLIEEAIDWLHESLTYSDAAETYALLADAYYYLQDFRQAAIHLMIASHHDPEEYPPEETRRNVKWMLQIAESANPLLVDMCLDAISHLRNFSLSVLEKEIVPELLDAYKICRRLNEKDFEVPALEHCSFTPEEMELYSYVALRMTQGDDIGDYHPEFKTIYAAALKIDRGHYPP